jgi:hypothetical protein
MPPKFSYLKTDATTTIFSPPLSPGATDVERKAYRRDVLHLPGPVDRWLLTNVRSPRIHFLRDYLMFVDGSSEYVTCTVEIETEVVCLIITIAVMALIFCLASEHGLLPRIFDHLHPLPPGCRFTSITDQPSVEDKPSGNFGAIHRIEYGSQCS